MDRLKDLTTKVKQNDQFMDTLKKRFAERSSELEIHEETMNGHNDNHNLRESINDYN